MLRVQGLLPIITHSLFYCCVLSFLQRLLLLKSAPSRAKHTVGKNNTHRFSSSSSCFLRQSSGFNGFHFSPLRLERLYETYVRSKRVQRYAPLYTFPLSPRSSLLLTARARQNKRGWKRKQCPSLLSSDFSAPFFFLSCESFLVLISPPHWFASGF